MGSCHFATIILVLLIVVSVSCKEESNDITEQFSSRTLVHNTVKRFMVLLPAIFFKLGVAFTLLVLVTVVSINNGFIGFLLLVVGLSNVLARLQEARKPAPLPYLPQYYHLLDRSDSLDRASDVNKEQKSGYNQQLYYYGQKARF